MSIKLKKFCPNKFFLKNTILTGLVAILGSLSSINVYAQNTQNNTPPNSSQSSKNEASINVYSGTTLDKIMATGNITIGVRPSSIPLSFYVNNQPVGYGLDICLLIVENLKKEYGLPHVTVSYKEVSGVTRIPEVVSGNVDLECGSTTTNATRRKEVDFSIPYYISGVRILTKKDSGIQLLNDLRGKKVSLGAGTTSIDLMKKINIERAMGMTLIVEPSFGEALLAVDSDKADAFVLDDLLLFSERSKVHNPEDFIVVGEFLSVEPLAIMFRKNDPEFKNFVNKQMNNFIVNGTIDSLYKKWFESPIPPEGKNLNIPQSYLLKDIFRMPTDIVGN